MQRAPESHVIAAFFDLENLAIGVGHARQGRFDVAVVLTRLLEKGNVIVKKAYADWEQLVEYKRGFHESAIELIEMPGSKITGKNSADIKMVVDALELCYTKPHIDTFALVSGDSDFSPLVSRLRENGKYVIGVGAKKSSSPLLIDNCDEFVFYDDLVSKARPAERRGLSALPKKKQEAFQQLLDAAFALQRDERELRSSVVKDTMKRRQPQFNEEYHGYASFSRLLEDAERNGLVRLRRDPRSGTYVIDDIVDA